MATRWPLAPLPVYVWTVTGTGTGESTIDTLSEASLADSPAASRTEPQLFLALECGRPLSSGARYSLAEVDEIVVGRGTSRESSRGPRQLTVRVPDRWMSSTHARIVRAVDTWTLEDAQSTNGCFVNGERVTSATLAPDDLIELGHTLFFLRDIVEIPSTATATDFDACEHVADVMGMATLVPSFAAQLAAIARVSSTSIPVLLLGETGTGKEVMAHAIHTLSGRAGAFAAVNCGAIPETLLESQLFGHVKGAFSGALRDALGFVRSAEGGTLFLDEIGDLSLRSQAALLRVLQEREVIPVGATRPIKVDIRIISATHRPLEALAARGEFRSDLFARLAGLRVVLPPLRERREDIGLLVADVLRAVTPARADAFSFGAAAGRALALYDWPLNIRELQQALALGTALATEDVIELAHLPVPVAAARARVSASNAPASLTTEDERLRAELLAHLEVSGGNISEVARSMGKARTQIHRWIKRFAIDLDAFRR